jgi:hypothetical protein
MVLRVSCTLLAVSATATVSDLFLSTRLATTLMVHQLRGEQAWCASPSADGSGGSAACPSRTTPALQCVGERARAGLVLPSPKSIVYRQVPSPAIGRAWWRSSIKARLVSCTLG